MFQVPFSFGGCGQAPAPSSLVKPGKAKKLKSDSTTRRSDIPGHKIMITVTQFLNLNLTLNHKPPYTSVFAVRPQHDSLPQRFCHFALKFVSIHEIRVTLVAPHNSLAMKISKLFKRIQTDSNQKTDPCHPSIRVPA